MRTARPRRGPLALLAGAAALLAPALSAAQGQALVPQLEGRALVEALARGGYVILLRHTATDDTVPDEGFDLGDCSTQRSLTEEGQEQARQIGRAAQQLGVRVSKVLSSPYCRCLETAQLAFGGAEVSQTLAVGDELSGPAKDEMGAAIRALLDTPPEPGTNSVLVTHTGNLLYSFGLRTRPEGIAHVFRPTEYGPAAYQGFLTPSDWVALAGEAAPDAQPSAADEPPAPTSAPDSRP